MNRNTQNIKLNTADDVCEWLDSDGWLKDYIRIVHNGKHYVIFYK